MFLKRIEMQGFKSFADHTVINFEDSITGVVGPNGCGKSNISDAIRWVLGEQSIKSLRGEKMTDVIFAGADGRKAQNMAEVSLIFDNSNHLLNSDYEELEITRRLYNTNQEAEYLINRNPVRLKDIVELILDSGLGKDSLSIISQGNIASFAEAKPYDRRAVFEEAAGVAKYKKRKIESLNKLQRTKENLERTFDILQELEKQVSPLKRQAKKAELYREKKQRLQEIEIAVLVDEINNCQKQKDELEKSLFQQETNLAMCNTSIQINENNALANKNNLKEFDKEINYLQDKLVNVINTIQKLETSKIELDEKRKYNIEKGNKEEKIKETKALLDEAEFEYNDRLKRLNVLNNEFEILNQNLEEIAKQIANDSLNKEEKNNLVNRIENRINVLENIIKDPFSANAQAGVKAIMSNQNAFFGVMGVVGQALIPQKDYEYALSSALANATYHIITQDEKVAAKCVDFLKKNRSGRATFLPLNVLKIHDLKYEDEIICNNTDGYLGIIADFVECEEKYSLVRDSLLGNVLVCDNLDNANNLAQLLKFAYKIVTLDGEIVHRGGSITGGKVKNEISFITASSELDEIKENLVSYKAQSQLANNKYEEDLNKKRQIENELTEKRISIAQIESILDVKEAKYNKLKNDYALLAPELDDVQTNFEDSLLQQLNDNYVLKDEVGAKLKIKREDRMKLSAEIDRNDQQMRQLRRQLSEANNNIIQLTNDKAIVDTRLENSLMRLSSEYKMTFEFALQNTQIELKGNEIEEVKQLRFEIENLGNINMSAPEEYEQINQRYEFLNNNYNDLISSRDKILDAIEEMDKIMKKQFKETFDAINANLNDTFTVLFGGGRAKLVLEDENDILNTGIDIDVQPPGKQVKSIRLFSGGEKTLIAMCVLFTILKVKPAPLIIFDEVEAALDQGNVERFAKYVKQFSNDSQFLIITHRPGTMEQCDTLYGVTMQKRGVSQLLKVKLLDAIQMAEEANIAGA